MIYAIIGSMTGTGIFLLLTDLFNIPDIRTSRAFLNLSKRQRKKTGVVELWLEGIAAFLSRHIRINEYKRIQLASDLKTAGNPVTPERYLANAFVKAGICGVLTIPAFFVFPLIVPVMIALTAAVYAKSITGIQNQIKEKRRAIDYELPRLVFTVEQTLMHSRDVLAILDSYRQNAGQALKEELNITIADMRSGNYESALIRLEARVGSTMLSDVIRGLISILRGDETAQYWTALSIKFSDIQRQMLKTQAIKVPGKVKKLSMILLFCFMMTYIVILATEILSSVNVLFG